MICAFTYSGSALNAISHSLGIYLYQIRDMNTCISYV